MPRLINADELKNLKFVAAHKDSDYARGWNDAIDAIMENQPTEKPEPQWIPCSERLPEYFESVLTWDGHCYSVEKRIPYIRDEDGEPIKSEWWVSDDYDEDETDYYPNLRDGAAIAWKPLPEPYEVKE